MSAPSHLLYLLACASLDEPDAGWAIDGDGLANAAGDRIAVTVRFHGYTAAIRRAGCRKVDVGHAERLDALWGRLRDAARVRVRPEWLCIDADEPENVLMFRADTEDAARTMAKAEIDSVEDWHVIRITPQMRRRWRYHERKEEGTLPARKSRATPCSPEAEAWYRGLEMTSWMSLERAKSGRLLCATCRRYVTLDDLAGARTSSIGGGVCIDYGASCRRCRGVA